MKNIKDYDYKYFLSHAREFAERHGGKVILTIPQIICGADTNEILKKIDSAHEIDLDADSQIQVLDNAAHFNFAGITDVIISEGIKYVYIAMFFGCEDLINVSIPGSVSVIGGFAFEGCRNLAHVKISEGVTEIENCAFAYCGSLDAITIPDSVTKISDTAFKGCDRLTILGNSKFQRVLK